MSTTGPTLTSTIDGVHPRPTGRDVHVEQFEPRRYQDPAVDRFTRERVKVVEDPSLQGTAAVVEVNTRSGATFSDRRACAKGDPDDPLTRAEIREKLHVAAEGLLARAQIERLIVMVDRLEQVADVRELTAALRLQNS